MKALLPKLGLALSLICASAVLMVWVRTYFVGDRYRGFSLNDQGTTANYRMWGFTAGMGGLELSADWSEVTDVPQYVGRMRLFYSSPRYAQFGYRPMTTPRYPLTVRDGEESLLTSLGMRFNFNEYLDEFRGVSVRRYGAVIPFWAIFALTAIYPIAYYATGVVRRQREERESLHCCPRCGEKVPPEATQCLCCDRPILAAEL